MQRDSAATAAGRSPRHLLRPLVAAGPQGGDKRARVLWEHFCGAASRGGAAGGQSLGAVAPLSGGIQLL